MRDIIFLRANYFMGHFKGIFLGGQDFFDPLIVPRCALNNLGRHSVYCSRTSGRIRIRNRIRNFSDPQHCGGDSQCAGTSVADP